MSKNSHSIYPFFYGVEALSFAFFRVPKLLFTDRFKGLSNDAKLLYGLCLSKTTLSYKNGWIDSENRIFIIYTVNSICEDLNIGNEKACRLLAQLTSAGLLTRVKRGQGHPDLLYLHNFFDSMSMDDVDIQTSENPISKNPKSGHQESEESDVLKSEIPTPENRKSQSLNIGNSDTNNINLNHNKNNNINLSIDTTDEVDDYIARIKKNVDYDIAEESLSKPDFELFDELVDLIIDVVCNDRTNEGIPVNGVNYNYKIVKNKFLKLNYSHLEYVMETYKKVTATKKIENVRAYLITSLYNASSTMNHYYSAEANKDFHNHRS